MRAYLECRDAPFMKFASREESATILILKCQVLYDLIIEKLDNNKLTHFFCGAEISLSDILIASFTATVLSQEPVLFPLVLEAYSRLKPYFSLVASALCVKML